MPRVPSLILFALAVVLCSCGMPEAIWRKTQQPGKPGAPVGEKKADALDPGGIVQEFKENRPAAMVKYGGKEVTVAGEVELVRDDPLWGDVRKDEVRGVVVHIKPGIEARVPGGRIETTRHLKAGAKVVMRGHCVGYDPPFYKGVVLEGAEVVR